MAVARSSCFQSHGVIVTGASKSFGAIRESDQESVEASVSQTRPAAERSSIVVVNRPTAERASGESNDNDARSAQARWLLQQLAEGGSTDSTD